MPVPDDHTAFELLERQAARLVDEQKVGRRTLFEALARDIEIDRRIRDCIAGARAFGKELVVPEATTLNVPYLNPSSTLVPSQAAVPAHLRHYVWFRTQLINLRQHFVSDDKQPLAPVEAVPTAGPMPKIADVVMERLRAAGKEGTKAAAIQQFITHTYGEKIHEKTVGMTLYRLQKAGEVRRDKHTWFLASSEAKNPSAVNAGAH